MVTLNDMETKLVDQLKVNDYETYSHSVRVMELTEQMLKATNKYCLTSFSTCETDIICKGAFLHDIGKMYVDSTILKKKEALSENEIKHLTNHTWLGYRAIKNELADSEHEIIKNICLYHHERIDGGGYEHKTDLPVYVQIISVCDVYDALHSDRVYRKGLPRNECLKLIRDKHDRSGVFNDKLVDILEKVI